MVNKELKSVIDYMEREKGIERNVLIETIKSSLQSAARKSVSEVLNPIIEIDDDTFDVKVHESLMVIEDGQIPEEGQVCYSKIYKKVPSAKIGSSVLLEVTPKNFGRIAAQTAKQVIIQKLRDAQADAVYNEYKDKVWTVIAGTVRHIENKHIVLDLGRGEAILKQKEQIENEDYHIGDRLKVLLIEVKKGTQSPEIIVSRSHPTFVKKLFEIEVPEIHDGIVEIKGVAREPGYRTKIAVYSTDSKIDSVGACVGMRGSRVKNIVQELNGEKIDIVPFASDLSTFCRNAMSPAKLKHVIEDTENNSIKVLVEPSQLSLAIGKKGHNAKLTSKLLGCKIDVEVVEEGQEIANIPLIKKDKEEKAIKTIKLLNVPIDEIEEFSKKVKEYFIQAGYETLEDLKSVKIDELYTIPGVGKTTAEEIMELINKSITKHS